jgi:hypothetical protein
LVIIAFLSDFFAIYGRREAAWLTVPDAPTQIDLLLPAFDVRLTVVEHEADLFQLA